jgi:hypothetical protein
MTLILADIASGYVPRLAVLRVVSIRRCLSCVLWLALHAGDYGINQDGLLWKLLPHISPRKSAAILFVCNDTPYQRLPINGSLECIGIT